MRSVLIALCAGAGLAGCVAYGDPYGYPGYYGQPDPYYGSYPGYGYVQPGYIQGGVTVYQGYDDRRGHRRYHRGMRDRDGDGIPNRMDRDRDGDGVPNRFDDRPNNPRRR